MAKGDVHTNSCMKKNNTHIIEQRVHNTHITANYTLITALKYIMWLLRTIMHHINCT